MAQRYSDVVAQRQRYRGLCLGTVPEGVAKLFWHSRIEKTGTFQRRVRVTLLAVLKKITG
jgi:hypothetical protein